jgi:predicted dehydrogenase
VQQLDPVALLAGQAGQPADGEFQRRQRIVDGRRGQALLGGAERQALATQSLGATLDVGRKIMAEAAKRGLTVGCAPDTVLGAGIQTSRRLIDGGEIGRPLNASAFMIVPGHELWHPSPEFYYQPGGGPLMDMGPYYVTALVQLLGSAESVTGMARASFPSRTIHTGPKEGTAFPVDVETHVGALIRFRSGAIANLLMSFDTQAAQLPHIEVYGSGGTLSAPDPNTFGGPVTVCPAGSKAFDEKPLTFPFPENSRGLGLSDQADAILTGRAPRAGGALGLHVLEILCGILESAASGASVRIESNPERPEPMAAL